MFPNVSGKMRDMDMTEIGKLIRTTREALPHSPTIKEFAETCGLSANVVGDMERGARPGESRTRRLIEQGLGWPPYYIDQLEAASEPPPITEPGARGRSDDLLQRLEALVEEFAEARQERGHSEDKPPRAAP